MKAYDDLMAHQRDTEALAQISGRLGWDQETVMPKGSAAQRGEEMAAMESVLHARRTDPRIGDWLAALDGSDLTDRQAAQVQIIRRDYLRNTRVPVDLAAALAKETSLSQGIWARARAEEDFNAFAPALGRVLRLRQQEADAIAAGGDRYEALLQDYEPGAKLSDIVAMFDALRPRLVALRDRVMGSPKTVPEVVGHFDEVKQMRMAQEVAERFGYDFTRGRLDKAVHPFSSGSGADVRITTRTSATDPFNCIYSTIHEVGHGSYEQSIDSEFHLSPVGQGVSMGVHESQSRIYENQLGRGRAFTGWLFEAMKAAHGDVGIDNADAFHAAVNRVAQGYIRTESDELQYNLHILLRFDIERALIAGDLAVADLPDAWNERFKADFGFAVDKPSNGCLQDVHWSVGLFGYFPTYTLGNVYAGCLYSAMRDALPDLDESLSRGEITPATNWLCENLQRHGGLRSPRATIEHACGFSPSEAPLLDYLEAKFSAIYDI